MPKFIANPLNQGWLDGEAAALIDAETADLIDKEAALTGKPSFNRKSLVANIFFYADYFNEHYISDVLHADLIYAQAFKKSHEHTLENRALVQKFIKDRESTTTIRNSSDQGDTVINPSTFFAKASNRLEKKDVKFNPDDFIVSDWIPKP